MCEEISEREGIPYRERRIVDISQNAMREHETAINETWEVDTFGYSDLALYIEVNGACVITLDAVSQVSGDFDDEHGVDSFITINETVATFLAAGSELIDLNVVLATKEALKFRFLRFKINAAVTMTFVMTGKLPNSSAVTITSLPSVSTATPTKVAVGVASTAALAANANRKFAVFVNDSNETIYLSLSGTAVINEGIRLNANGGAYETSLLNLYTGAVTAICASGGKNLTVTEG
ncbi:unnamed protein product [marine sediment metagenome]|uniref:Uncharacterized protein n=1 Tax=marine sediment metagenome TaxID=412755 RepID=X1E0H4_9ZZZZ